MPHAYCLVILREMDTTLFLGATPPSYVDGNIEFML